MKNREATVTEAAAFAEQGANVASEPAATKKTTTRSKSTPKGRPAVKSSKPAKPAAKKEKAATNKKAAKAGAKEETTAPRAEGKGAKVLELIARPKGATLAEITQATDWQAHSVRGFISTATKKKGIKIESAKNEAGERVYKATK